MGNIHRHRNTNFISPGSSPTEFCTLISSYEDGTPFLYLGSASSSVFSVQQLHKHNIHYIMNVTDTEPNIHKSGINYLRISIEDTRDVELSYYLPRALDFIKEAYANKKGILVHCYAGISRSASIVISYLMQEYKMSLREAVLYVSERRRVVRPNSGFFECLTELEAKLRSTTTPSISYHELCTIHEKYNPDKCYYAI
jgi:protein-tyrosine phosphatase